MQKRERELSHESNKGISHLTWALEDNKYMEIKTQRLILWKGEYALEVEDSNQVSTIY